MKKYKEFINESNDDDYEMRFGKKETYEELKDKFKPEEKVTVTRIDRNGQYDQDCVIKKIFFDEMEGHWSAELDNNTIRSLNQLRKIQ